MEVDLKLFKSYKLKNIDAKVVVVITNNSNAGVLERAESYNILFLYK